MASDDTASVPDGDDKSAKAFTELIRVLEAAAWTNVESVRIEWSGNELMVFHESGGVEYGATTINPQLQLEVIAEIVQRAHIGRNHKGNVRLRLLGQEYRVAVKEYDSCGESALTLTLTNPGQKRAK